MKKRTSARSNGLLGLLRQWSAMPNWLAKGVCLKRRTAVLEQFLIVGRDLCIGNEALSAAGHELLELVLLYPSSAHSMLCVPGYPWQTLGCSWPAGQKVDNRGGILRCPWPCPAAVRARQKQLVASLGLQSRASKRLV